MDYFGLLLATDLWGLTAGKVDQSVHCVGKSVTFVHWEVRSTAGGRLLSVRFGMDRVENRCNKMHSTHPLPLSLGNTLVCLPWG